MNGIKITIATVCYNAVDDIENVIRSVCHQTYDNIEYIIIDGDSTDGTLDVIQRNEAVITKWISERDNGVYDAMNKVLGMASGDFLLFLGADDHLMSHDTIMNVVQNIEDKNAVYYGDVYRNTRNDIYRGKFNKYMFACENICHQAILYPQCVYKKMNYDLAFPVYADYVYNLRAWKEVTFHYIPICISYFNCTGISGSGNDAMDEKYGKGIMQEVKCNLGWLCFLLKVIYKLYKKKSW